jgi:hypothetical protein
MTQVGFDTALNALLEICCSTPDWNNIARAVVVRDLRGRFRLVLQPKESCLVPAVEAQLKARLRQWYADPLLSTISERIDERRLAGEILQRATSWPPEWQAEWTDPSGSTVSLDTSCWKGIQRVL